MWKKKEKKKRKTKMLPKMSPSVACHGHELPTAGVPAQEDMHVLTKQKHGVIWRGDQSGGCHRKRKEWSCQRCWLLKHRAASMEVQEAQGCKEAKEDPEKQVRKRGTGKEPSSRKQQYCHLLLQWIFRIILWGKFCLFLPKETTLFAKRQS